MRTLLAPEGCPWDREQNLETLKPFLLEETYEVLDAMSLDTAQDHCEELGDLLMQIVFHAELQKESFDMDDVIGGISDKLVRRHPHVFSDSTAETSDEVLRQWDEIKAAEKSSDSKEASVLDNIPLSMPALSRAQKTSKRVAKVGFDWPNIQGSRAKISEELDELDEAILLGKKDAVEEEIGDLLFAIVNLARKVECDAELCLKQSTEKFTNRFQRVEEKLRARAKGPKDSTLEEMDALWNEVKTEA